MTQLGEATVPIRATMDKLDKDLAGAKSTFEKVSGEISKGFGMALGFGVAEAVSTAIGAIKQFAVDSVREFQTFEAGAAEVFTLIPQASAQARDAMKADILAFSTEVGRTTDEVIPALYQSISAGVPAENVFDFLATANEAALGGVTDLETAVNALSGVVNTYGAENITAADAADVMFTAVKLGKTTFEELSNSIANVLPTAQSLGISFEDVIADLTVLTTKNVSTAQGTTQLRAAFIEASKSGTGLSGAIKDLTGQSFADLINSGQSTSAIFQMLRQSMPEQDFRDLFSSVEAANAVLLLTGDNAEQAADTLAAMGDTAGAVGEAAETMQDSGVQASRELAAAFEELKITIGEELAPDVVELTRLLTDAAGQVSAIVGPLSTMNDWAKLTGGTVQGLGFAMGQSLVQGKGLTGAFEELLKQEEDIYKATKDVVTATEDIADSAEAAAMATEAEAEVVDEVAASLEYARMVAADLATEDERLAVSAADVAAAEEARELAHEEATEAARTAAEQLDALNTRMGGYFASALEGRNETGLFTTAIANLGEQYVTTGGRTAEQNELLDDLESAYGKAADTIRDLEFGVKGFGLEEEALNEKIEEQAAIMANAEAAMQPLLAITGEVSQVTNEAQFSSQALAREMFAQGEAANLGAEEMAIFAAATGDFTQEEIEAAFEAALMTENIHGLVEAVKAGELTAIQATDALALLQTGEADTAEEAIALAEAARDAEAGITAAGHAAGDAAPQLDDVTLAAGDARAALLAIPTDIQIQITTNINQVLGDVADFDWEGQAESIGESFGGGVEEGINSSSGDAAQAAANLANSTVEAAADAIGAESPSQRAREEVGQAFGMGVIWGIEDTIPGVRSTVNDFVDIIADGTDRGVDDWIDIIADGGDRVVDQVQMTAEEAGSLLGELLIESVQANADDVQTAIVDLFDVGDDIARLGSSFIRMFEEQTIEPLQDNADSIADSIAAAEDRIAEGMGMDFEDIDLGALFRGEIGTPRLANEARELLELYDAQRAANEEIRIEQERIVQLQQQQADFEFLQQQMELLSLIQSAGLDPADILGGLELGLNASLPDLIAAMSAAMQAIIGQAEEDLGIASPSTVAEELMVQFGAGGVRGLDEATMMIGRKADDLADELFRPFAAGNLGAIADFARRPMPALDVGLPALDLSLAGLGPAFAGDGPGDTFIFQFPADMAKRDQIEIERMIDTAFAKRGTRADTRIRTR